MLCELDLWISSSLSSPFFFKYNSCFAVLNFDLLTSLYYVCVALWGALVARFPCYFFFCNNLHATALSCCCMHGRMLHQVERERVSSIEKREKKNCIWALCSRTPSFVGFSLHSFLPLSPCRQGIGIRNDVTDETNNTALADWSVFFFSRHVFILSKIKSCCFFSLIVFVLCSRFEKGLEERRNKTSKTQVFCSFTADNNGG